MNIDLEALIRDEEDREEVRAGRRQDVPDPTSAWRIFGILTNRQGIEITDEHRYAFDRIVVRAENAFLTGGAGVGKTTFLKLLIAALAELNERVAVTATTGIAGSHLSGRTIHSWAGIGLGPFFPTTVNPVDMPRDQVERIYQSTYDSWLQRARHGGGHFLKGVKRRIQLTSVLVVDEISMCHGVALLDYVDFFFRLIRETDEPFGGIQMLFAGDFGQLPPVEKKAGSRPDWAFLSRSWAGAKVRDIELTKVFRQADVEFATYLNRRRVGIPMSQEEREYTRRFVRPVPEDEAIRKSHLVTTNDKADRINNAALQCFQGPDVVIDAKFFIQQHHLAKDDTVSSVRQRLLRGTMLRERLLLRADFPVLMTVNTDEYVNGSKGVFVAYDEDADKVSVRLSNGRQISVSRVKKAGSGEDPDAMVRLESGDYVPKHPRMEQFPVMPAVAITAHKCVDKSTLVPTNKGMQTMESICDSKESVAVFGMSKLVDACEPFVGTRELGYRIVTARGYALTCSERHPLLRMTEDGARWELAPYLSVGDSLVMRGGTMAFGAGDIPVWDQRQDDYHTCNAYKLPTHMTDELAWLLGALIGDGCVTDRRDGRVDITSTDSDIIGRFSCCMSSVFGVTTTTKPKGSAKATTTYCHNWGVRRFLQFLGLDFSKAPAKRVPACVWGSTQTQQANFLRGYFDTDGGVNSGVHVTSSSKLLLSDVHLMLLNFGIESALDRMTDRAWRVNISGVNIVRFYERIGFSCARKSNACASVSPSWRKVLKAQIGFFPRAYGRAVAAAIRTELREALPGRFVSRNKWAQYLSRVSCGTAGLTHAHLAALSADFPEATRTGEVSARHCADAVNGVFLDRIESIDRLEGDMRDICVPDGHAFVGNGFVNHNSQGMTLEDCVVDLSRTFAPGQVYVAVSRVRSPEGLFLTTPDFEAQVCPYVLRFYADVRNRMAAGMRELAETNLDQPPDTDRLSPPNHEYSTNSHLTAAEGGRPPDGDGID